jgi:hypothetical protein
VDKENRSEKVPEVYIQCKQTGKSNFPVYILYAAFNSNLSIGIEILPNSSIILSLKYKNALNRPCSTEDWDKLYAISEFPLYWGKNDQTVKENGQNKNIINEVLIQTALCIPLPYIYMCVQFNISFGVYKSAIARFNFFFVSSLCLFRLRQNNGPYTTTSDSSGKRYCSVIYRVENQTHFYETFDK